MVHFALRYIRLLTGLLLLIVGAVLALPLVPGPGIPLIILGLVLLSDHFPWAKRALHWLKEKTRRWPGSSERTARDKDIQADAGPKQSTPEG